MFASYGHKSIVIQVTHDVARENAKKSGPICHHVAFVVARASYAGI
jgi:hypothetical protein